MNPDPPPSRLTQDGVAVPIGHRSRVEHPRRWPVPLHGPYDDEQGIELGGVVFHYRAPTPWEARVRRALVVVAPSALVLAGLVLRWMLQEAMPFEVWGLFGPVAGSED